MSQNHTSEQARQEKARWTITFVIWFIGAAGLWFAWEFQKTIAGGFGEFLAFVIQVIGYFYIFAIFPIRQKVSKFLGGKEGYDSPLN